MAIVVNKEEKRRAIALSGKALLLEHGIKNITISKIAQTANVGKGTIYEYFANKEDIVFEIISVFIAEYEEELYAISTLNIPVREKLFRVLYSMYGDSYRKKQLAIYREYLAISLTSDIEGMVTFSQNCRDRILVVFETILKDAIANGEVKPQTVALASMLHTYALGLIVETKIKNMDPKLLIDQMIEVLFGLITKQEL